MKISKNLPQFPRRSLLIVAGKEEARFWLAETGAIEERLSFRVPEPRYTDKEGFFKTPGGRNSFSAGEADEPKKQEIASAFLHELRVRLKALDTGSIKGFFVFCPGYQLNSLLNNLPKSLKNKLKFSFAGNYLRAHPYRLLELIQKRQEERRPRLIPEASRKLLNNADRARRATKRRTY